MSVESGVRSDLRKLGIPEPSTALENTAVTLAKLLDDDNADAKTAAGIARELRLTMLAIAGQETPGESPSDQLAARVREAS